MKINVSDIIEEPGISVSFSETGPVEPFGEDTQDIVLRTPFSVKGVATSTGEGVYVQANVRGNGKLTCSRCLTSFDMEFQFDCEGRFVEDPERISPNDENDIETFALDGEFCKLDEMIQHELLLNIPMKPLCNSGCKGLCEVCGANLNKAPCECLKSDSETTVFGKKLLEALERGKENGSSKEEDIGV